MKKIVIACVLFLHSTFAILAQTSSPKHIALNKLVDNYYDDYLKFNPIEATAIGSPEYNDTLVNEYTDEYLGAYKMLTEKYIKLLEKISEDDLSTADKITYACFKNKLDRDLLGFQFPSNLLPFDQFRGMHLYFGQLASGKGIQPFKNFQDYINFNKRLKLYAKYISGTIKYLKKGIKDNVTLPKAIVPKIINQFESLTPADYKNSVYYASTKVFPESITESQKQKIEALYKKSILEDIYPAHEKMIAFLQNEYLPKARTSTGWSDLPNGNEWYNYHIYYWTTLHKKPEEIYHQGLKEVERIKKEMVAIKDATGFEGTLQDFFHFVKTDSSMFPFSNSDEVLAFYNKIYDKLKPQVGRIFHAFPKSKFEIRRTEAFRENSASAEYNPPSTDGSRPGIFYIPIPDAKKYNITSGTESLFLHEAIPGHHYQISLQQENENLPRFRKYNWIGAYGEGWALYCESLGKELGLYTDPYQYLGALSDEMHRAVRLVVDVGIHTGKMNREEAIEYMMKNEPIDKQGAVAEIERYMVLPAQALSYKTGSLKIKELRDKYSKALGDKFDLAAFHDEVLKDGNVPLNVLEQKLQAWAKKQKDKS